MGKNKKKLLIFAVIAAAVVVILCAVVCVLWRSALVPVSEDEFSAERIAEIGQEYNMDLTDVELKIYQHKKAPDSISDCEFVVDDHAKFMGDRFNGEIIRTNELSDNEIEYVCKPYEDSDDQRKTRMYVTFRRKNDKWNCHVAHSVYVG